jgi:hypothetical protein
MTRLARLPTGSFIVILPKSMIFNARPSTSYETVNDAEIKGQVYLSRNVLLSQPLSFMVEGAGQIPRETQDTADTGPDSTAIQSGSPERSTTGSQPGGGLGNPIDPEGVNEPLAKSK